MNDPEIIKELKGNLSKHKTNIILTFIAIWVMFCILDRMSDSYQEFEIEHKQQMKLQLAYEQAQAAKSPNGEVILTPMQEQNKMLDAAANEAMIMGQTL